MEQATHDGRTLRTWLVLAPFSILVVIWCWSLYSAAHLDRGPSSHSYGEDFALSMTGAYALLHHANPYNVADLARVERQFLGRQGFAIELDQSTRPIEWVGNPPLYFWALQPLTRFPFRQTLTVWIVAMYACMAIGFLAALSYAGWKTWLVPCVLFLGMPQTTMMAYFANPAPIVMAVTYVSLLLQRTRPYAAGVLFTLTFLKPQLALIGFIMITVFHTREVRKFVAGLATGVTVALVLTELSLGSARISQWVAGLLSTSRITGQQPNLAPLVGLYSGWTPSSIRVVLEALVLLCAALITILWRARTNGISRQSAISTGWLYVVWMLALPYAHFSDEILLALPVLALLGLDGCNVRHWSGGMTLYLLYFSVLLFSARVGNAQLLFVPLVAVALIAYRAASTQEKVTDEATESATALSSRLVGS